MNYSESIEWLYSTQMFGIKLGLDAPRKLLRKFLAFPVYPTKVIHVAGTNGKGSTCAIIDSLARSLGERSGLFTSPHLINYRERVRIMGQEISEEKTATLLTELRNLVSDWEPHPTFFELTLALAMRHFRDEKCRLIILETGMGGRLDATTAVPADVCVLTPIALDHTKWLGDSLEEIATEKAGISVQKKPLISALQKEEAALAIQRATKETRSPLKFINKPIFGYHINLPGEHQRYNAALACEAMNAAGFELNFDIVQHGLANIQWPGRFEIINETLILDAAHNPHAAHSLVETWQSQFGTQKAHCIYGSVEDKETKKVLEIISPIVEHFHFVPINSPRSLPPEQLSALISEIPYSLYHSVEKAMLAGKNLTLITGSLFLLGEAKGILAQQKTYETSQ